MTRASRGAAYAVVTLLLQACASPGPAPSPPPLSGPTNNLHLKAGRNYFSMISFGLSNDPLFPPCVPLGEPPEGTGVATQVDLQLSGLEWIGRSPTGMGTLEIHIRELGPFEPGVPNMGGTMSGTAIDLGEGGRPPLDVMVTVPELPLTLEGSAVFSNYLSSGRFSGLHTYSNSKGRTGTCTAAQWLLQPTSGIFSASTGDWLLPFIPPHLG